MADLAYAIEFNKKAAKFLEGGSIVDALHMLQGALQIMSQVDRYGSVQESNPCIKQASAKILHETEPTVTDEVLDSNTSFIYRKPIEWRPEVINKVLRHKSLLLAIMFNMGLVNHLYALEQTSFERQELLQRAAMCYHLAYDLLFDEEVSKKRFSIPPRRLSMAILNNMGQIYHELGQYDKAQAFLSELSEQLLEYKAMTNVENCFYVNTLILKPPSAAGAA